MGLAALPLQEEGPGRLGLAQDAEGVGVDGAAAVAVPEVPGRPPGRVELDYLPAEEARLPRQGRNEGVDGGGVLDVPEQLAAPAARHVAPVEVRLPDARALCSTASSPRPRRCGPCGPTSPAMRKQAGPGPTVPSGPFGLGNLTINYAERGVSVAGRTAQLTATEYELIFELRSTPAVTDPSEEGWETANHAFKSCSEAFEDWRHIGEEGRYVSYIMRATYLK